MALMAITLSILLFVATFPPAISGSLRNAHVFKERQLSNETASLLREALGAFKKCACLPEAIENEITIIKLAMSVNLSVILGNCSGCPHEVGIRLHSGTLGRSVLLISNAPSAIISDEDFMKRLLQYSDVIFMNHTVLLRMSPQIAAGRAFLPFRKAAHFFKEDRLPDLGGLTLTAALFPCPPLIFKTDTQNQVGYDGIEIFLLKELAKAMNFTWTANEIKENRYGNHKNNTWVGGVVESVLKQESDIGLGGFWISYDRYRFVELTADYTQMDIIFILPRRSRDEKWKSIYTPFSRQLWVCVVCAVVASFLALYTLSQLSGEGRNLHDWIFLVVGQFLGCSSLPSEGPAMFRIAALFVSVAALFVSTLYSSAIVSHLTSPPGLMRPQSVKDLVQMEFFWTLNYPIAKPYWYLRLENKWHKRFANRYQNHSYLKSNISSNRYAVLCKTVENVLVVEDAFQSPLSDSGVLKYSYTLPEVINNYLLRIGLMKGSPLVNHVSRILGRLKSGGIIRKVLKESVLRFGGLYETPINSAPTPLSVKSLQGAFFVLLFGEILAGVVFIIELFVSISIVKKNFF